MIAPRKVRKAVFPVGGLGTRFLPATKAMPKEMLPVVDKPLIQYVVEEAAAAGIEEFIFVTGRGKAAIEDHFDRSYELEATLAARGKRQELDILDQIITTPGSISYTRQIEPLGLGHAVWCARHLVGNEPFAVLLADDFVHAQTPCLKQMMEAYSQHGGAMAAVMNVPKAHVSRYGIVDVAREENALVHVKGVVEKPSQEEAPSTLAIIGRYILPPEIFTHLETQTRGAGGEIQLTDAFMPLMAQHPFYGYRFDGRRIDCGAKAGLIQASLAVALTRPDLRDDILSELELLRATLPKTA